MNKFHELMESIDVLIQRRLTTVTKITYGIVTSVDTDSCGVNVQGKSYTLPFYGALPEVNKKYPVCVPQGNFSQAFIIG